MCGVYACACVCVCVCVFIFFYRKGLSLLNKAINVVPRVQVSDGTLTKYFRVKYLCRHVIGNYSRNLQASNCAKDCQLNRADP